MPAAQPIDKGKSSRDAAWERKRLDRMRRLHGGSDSTVVPADATVDPRIIERPSAVRPIDAASLPDQALPRRAVDTMQPPPNERIGASTLFPSSGAPAVVEAFPRDGRSVPTDARLADPRTPV